MLQVISADTRGVVADNSDIEEAANDAFRVFRKHLEIGGVFEEYGIEGGFLVLFNPLNGAEECVIRIGDTGRYTKEIADAINACAALPCDPLSPGSRHARMQEHHRNCAAAVKTERAIIGFRFSQEEGTRPFEGDFETAEFSDFCELFILAVLRVMARGGTPLISRRAARRMRPRYEKAWRIHFQRFV